MWIPQQCITSKNNFFIRQQKFKVIIKIYSSLIINNLLKG